MSKNLPGIVAYTALMVGGALAVAYGILAPEQTKDIRIIVVAGVCALLAGSGGFQQMWWAKHKHDGVDLRKKPRYPEDLGPGPSGRRTDALP